MVRVRWLMGLVCISLVLTVTESRAAPQLSNGVRIAGAVAYQDSADKNQFYFLPTAVPLILNDTLTSFSAKYWGVGRRFLEQDDEYGIYTTRVGGVIAGNVIVKLTAKQEKLLRKEIKRAYGIENPKLLPLDLKTKKVIPFVAFNSLGIDEEGDQVFPTVLKVEQQFPFVVGSPKSHTFAEYIAARTVDRGQVVADPSFSIYVTGESEFVGDPWKAHCRADMAQVWSSVRQRYGGSGGYGWFGITASYQSLVNELTRSKLIDCQFEEGSLDNEQFGRQVLEMAKKAFESINDPENAFFKFEPNPPAPDLPEDEGVSPYAVSLNLAYSSAYFKQEIIWEETLSYTGRVMIPQTVAIALAVKCNTATEELFQELGVSEPCITRRKAEEFDARASRENAEKAKLMRKLMADFASGRITPEAFKELKRFYSRVSIDDEVSIKFSNLLKISGSKPDDFKIIGGDDLNRLIQVPFNPELFEYIASKVTEGMTVKQAILDLRGD